VTNTPDVLTEATADIAFALLLSVSRRIVEGDDFVRRGEFNGWKPDLLLGKDLFGKHWEYTDLVELERQLQEGLKVSEWILSLPMKM